MIFCFVLLLATLRSFFQPAATTYTSKLAQTSGQRLAMVLIYTLVGATRLVVFMAIAIT